MSTHQKLKKKGYRLCGISCAFTPAGTSAQRDQDIKAFKQEHGPKVLLISPQHGGRGLHLTRGNRIIFMSPTWRKDDEAQATLRSHRIGQTKRVLVQVLVMKDSFEADLLARRNQLNTVEEDAQKQHHLKSEADDHELRWKLEHATFIDAPAGEEHLAHFSHWKRPQPLVQDLEGNSVRAYAIGRQLGVVAISKPLPPHPPPLSESPVEGFTWPSEVRFFTDPFQIGQQLHTVKREREDEPEVRARGVLIHGSSTPRPLKRARKTVTFAG